MYLFYVCVLSTCISVHHICIVPMEARKRHLIPWELRLQMVVSCHVGTWQGLQYS